MLRWKPLPICTGRLEEDGNRYFAKWSADLGLIFTIGSCRMYPTIQTEVINHLEEV